MYSELYDYAYYDSKQKNPYNRRCIDGHITGCGKCVGYCTYEEHSGFLTERLCKEHNCIEKGCYYYLPKPKQERIPDKKTCISDDIVSVASKITESLEGMKVLRATQNGNGQWNIKYVTISDMYPIKRIENQISEAVGETVIMINLNYDFDLAAKLIFA